jgi:hypothetical protein
MAATFAVSPPSQGGSDEQEGRGAADSPGTFALRSHRFRVNRDQVLDHVRCWTVWTETPDKAISFWLALATIKLQICKDWNEHADEQNGYSTQKAILVRLRHAATQ